MNVIALMQWKVGLIHKELWSKKAARGTILVQTNGREAQALLIDDDLGPRGHYQLAADKIDELVGAAAAAWVARGRSSGSFAVIIDTDVAAIGGVITPTPPPPPGPPGRDLLRGLTVQAHHQLLGVAELAEKFGYLGQFADKEGPR